MTSVKMHIIHAVGILRCLATRKTRLELCSNFTLGSIVIVGNFFLSLVSYIHYCEAIFPASNITENPCGARNGSRRLCLRKLQMLEAIPKPKTQLCWCFLHTIHGQAVEALSTAPILQILNPLSVAISVFSSMTIRCTVFRACRSLCRP